MARARMPFFSCLEAYSKPHKITSPRSAGRWGKGQLLLLTPLEKWSCEIDENANNYPHQLETNRKDMHTSTNGHLVPSKKRREDKLRIIKESLKPETVQTNKIREHSIQ